MLVYQRVEYNPQIINQPGLSQPHLRDETAHSCHRFVAQFQGFWVPGPDHHDLRREVVSLTMGTCWGFFAGKTIFSGKTHELNGHFQ